jgi:universal stress protein A
MYQEKGCDTEETKTLHDVCEAAGAGPHSTPAVRIRSKDMLQYEKVLCPIAFHANCFEALDVAWRCVDREAGTLYLLHVVRKVDPLQISAPFIEEHQIRDATERLRQIISEKLSGLNVEPVLRSGHPVEEIIEAQRQIGAGIIVLAKHNRLGLTRMFIGSVAERVVHNAVCAVLTVHPSDEAYGNKS